MKEIRMTEVAAHEAMAQIEALVGLTPKSSGCLRLLTEEMFSMCKELLEVELLDFDIKIDNNIYSLRVSTQTQVDTEAREHFLSMSSSGKNAADKGIKGLLGAVLEGFFHEDNTYVYGPALDYGVAGPGSEYHMMWTLSRYMETVPEENVGKNWDGIEKSIIANFSDDVLIGVRSGRLEMIVTKSI